MAHPTDLEEATTALGFGRQELETELDADLAAEHTRQRAGLQPPVTTVTQLERPPNL